MKYRLLPQAETDLSEILDYLASYSPSAAFRIADKLQHRWDLLCEQPFSGRRREDMRPGARSVVVGNYVTLYKVREEAIEIVRVFDGRRNITPDDLAP